MKTLKLWLKFMKMNIKRIVEYKEDFFIGIFAMILTNVITVLFYWVIMQNIPSINGWTLNELLFLFGIEAIAWGLWNTFLKGGAPWRIGKQVRDGTFDRSLIQPIGNLKYQLVSTFDTDGIGDLISGIFVLSISMGLVGIVWTPVKLIYLLAFLLSGAIIVFSTFLVLSTITFWTVEIGAIVDIMWTLGRFTEYPLDIYNKSIKTFLTFVLPLAFINYFPASAILGKGIWPQLQYLSPLVAVISFAVAYNFWKFGLKHYSSTGS